MRVHRSIPVAILLVGLGLLPGCGGGSRDGTGPADPTGSALTPICVVQGADHVSPLLGQRPACVTGVVTAPTGIGFYMEAPEAERDASPSTSEGIFVYTGDAPELAPGDEVAVRNAKIQEYGYGELTTTELADGEVELLGRDRPLPPPVEIGPGGLPQPGEVMDDDGLSAFEPEVDGLDFWESMEGMRARLADPVCVGPETLFGRIPVVAGGADAGTRTVNGGVLLTAGDLNPERIFLDDGLAPGAPKVKTGDRFSEAVVGVIGYAYGNYVLRNVAALPPLIDGGAEPARASLARDPEHLTIATWNVENLGPGQFRLKTGRGSRIAGVIVGRLLAPDIVALQEVQDGSGTKDDGVVDGRETWEALIRAVVAAGGPEYAFLEIAPEDGADGGQPGANIRVGMLYDPARVSPAERPPSPGDPAVAPVEVVRIDGRAALSHNPGRIDPSDPAWSAPEPSRRPLVAEFGFRGSRLFVVACHLKSRRQDDPLAGASQPPLRPTEAQRSAQARVVSRFVRDLLSVDPSAAVVALGDMNGFEFGPAVRELAGDDMENLVLRVPAPSRYTYVYEGNSQCLDHVIVSPGLGAAEVEIVHLAADFPEAGNASDHDPVLARLHLPVGDEH